MMPSDNALKSHGRFFNGLDHSQLMKKLSIMYGLTYDAEAHPDASFMPYSVMFLGNALILQFKNDDPLDVCVGIWLNRGHLAMEDTTPLKLESTGIDILSADELFLAAHRTRLIENAKTVQKLSRMPPVMDVIGIIMANDLTSVNWSEFGIGEKSHVPKAVTEYLIAKGYKVERTLSSNWSNETLHISINKEFIDDMIRYKELMK